MSHPTKITYILSDIGKAQAFEWVAERLDAQRFELQFILLNPGESHLEDWLKSKGIPVHRIPMRGKKDYVRAFFKLLKLLKKTAPDAVHMHLRHATILGTVAARALRIKKRIHTRHHSTYHHRFFPKAVKVDRFINQQATDIVAISQNVANVLQQKEQVPAEKVTLIHHGFDLKAFETPDPKRVERLREKYVPAGKGPIIGIIARYIKWKGHAELMPALAAILQKHPDAHFVFANANGPNKEYVAAKIRETLPESSFTEITFENDLFALYQLFDVYLHTPIDPEIEAFGQTYIEALAAGVPSVFTLSGIAHEFVKDNFNALVVPYGDANAVLNATENILADKALSAKLVTNGKQSIEAFGLTHFIDKLEALYLK